MKKNKVIASVLTASMAMSSVPAWAVTAADFSDMPQNWSTAALTKAVDNGLLAGIDGKICADDYLTRAQMAAIMVRAFGADSKADLSGYTDVQQGDWYYQALSTAVSMGVLSGYDNKLNPNANITRQEVCSVVARALMLEGGSAADLRQFNDADAVGSWAQGSMAAMAAAGYLHGDDGKLKPTAYITRAEFAAIMANLAGDYVNQAGTVTSVGAGNVVINAAGVTLADVTVQGDLILADGIGLGDVNLDNVKVTGRIVVRGGGAVSLTGSSSADAVKVANRNGKTELTVAEGAKVDSVTSSTALDVGGKGEVGTVTITAGTGNVTTPNTTVRNNGGVVTAAGRSVPNGATGVINSNATSATVTGGSSTAAGGGSSSSSGGGSSSGGSSSGGSTQSESVYVLMNIPYQAFYQAAEVSDSAFSYDAISSATNKTGNYGKAGGAYHEAATASIEADGTITAVGAANGAEFEGVIWPVKVSSLSALEALGGTKITDEDAKTVATFARGATSWTALVGYETLMEAPSYSYYVLSEAPANYMELTVTGTTPVFKAGENAVETAEAMEATATYGGNWGDVQLGLAADDVTDKIINAVVITAEDAAGRETKVGMVHLYNIWSANDIAWRAAQTPGLDGKTITNIRYYCSVKDEDHTDGTAPAYTNYVYDYPMNLEISAVYTGTVTAAFDGSSIIVTGLPEDAQNVKAKVYHTTGGRNPVYTYLTPLAVDPADDDIDPVTVDVVDGTITITPGSVTNQAGTTAEYGRLTEATEYTIELSSDNWMINKVTAVYEGDNAGKGEAETAQLIEDAQVVDVGWAQYLVVDLQEGSAANYEFAVDGQAVEVSAIDDAANLVKWELSSLQPGQLTVTRKLDGKQQTVTVTEGAAADTVRPSATAGPDYFLAHGAVYVWDYALTNYDAAGNVRVNPAKTTFDLAEETSSSTVAYYAPDAVLKAGGDNIYNVSGEVEVLFNYTTDADQAWFGSITDVDLVEYNDSLGTLNDALNYELDTADHYGSTVGQLTVPLGQSNFYSNGRYYLRVTSGGAATLIPIHVVNEQAPSMALSEVGTITSGQNVHFKVSNMTYGITMPIYRVDLTAPDGSTRTLEKIRDWYLIGDTFVLYNDVEATDGRDNIPENGLYTLTVYADGFKTMTKSFTVGNESKVSYVDVVSHATGAGSGGSSESGSEGGSNTMDANLLFDADLLANALILQDLGIENAYAAGIAERWLYDMSGWDAAFYQDGQTFYTFTGFRDAVETANVNGQYLTFQDYVAGGHAETTLNRPYAVKAVLEDNLLGETQTNGTYLGNAAADLFLVDEEGNGLTAAQEGKAVIFSCADADYLKAIAENGQIYRDQDWLNPLQAGVDYRVADGKLIISANVLQLGENHLVIEAAGYKALRLTVTVEKVLEDINLQVKAKADGTAYQVGETVTLEGLTADFLKYLQAVTVNKRNVLTEEAGGSSANDWYTPTENGLTLQGGLFQEAGNYEIAVRAEYYGTQTVTVTIAEKTTTEPIEPEQPEEQLEAPSPTGYNKGFLNYALEFGGGYPDYLAAIQAVSVDGVLLDKASSSWSLASGSFYTSQYGTGITFGSDILKDKNITVVVKADGYQDLMVVLDKDGNIVTDNTGSEGEGNLDNEGDGSSGMETNPGDNEDGQTKEPVIPTATSKDYSSDYQINFGYSSEDIAYLDAITGIDVNGSEYIATTDYFFISAGEYKVVSSAYYVTVSGSAFTEQVNTIVIHAAGYEDLTIYIDKDGNLLEEEALPDSETKGKQDSVVDDTNDAADVQQENAAETVNEEADKAVKVAESDGADDASQQEQAAGTEAAVSSL